jgi:hypothetical protein
MEFVMGMFKLLASLVLVGSYLVTCVEWDDYVGSDAISGLELLG